MRSRMVPRGLPGDSERLVPDAPDGDKEQEERGDFA
jgi:hypothetical protein